MADLAYNLASLSATADELAALAADFEGSGSYVDRGSSAVGHDKVVDALDHFVDNWRRHRESLTSSLTAVAEMAQACHDGLRDTDDALATAVTDAAGGS